MNTEEKFNELGVDAVTGVQLMDWMSLSQFDIADPQRFTRLQEIIDYLKKFPSDTQRFLVRKVTGTKNVDKLQLMWEYTSLLRKKESYEKEIGEIRSEGTAIGQKGDPILLKNLAEREIAARKSLSDISDEIAIYER